MLYAIIFPKCFMVINICHSKDLYEREGNNLIKNVKDNLAYGENVRQRFRLVMNAITAKHNLESGVSQTRQMDEMTGVKEN